MNITILEVPQLTRKVLTLFSTWLKLGVSPPPMAWNNYNKRYSSMCWSSQSSRWFSALIWKPISTLAQHYWRGKSSEVSPSFQSCNFTHKATRIYCVCTLPSFVQQVQGVQQIFWDLHQLRICKHCHCWEQTRLRQEWKSISDIIWTF